MTTIRVGSANINVENVEQHIAAEWQERKPTDDTPAGFAPSEAFKDYVQKLRDLRHRLSTELTERVNMGSALDKNDIEALGHLERLTFMAETDPEHQRRSAGLKMLAEGKAPFHGGLTESRQFANYMEEMNGPKTGFDHSGIDIRHI